MHRDKPKDIVYNQGNRDPIVEQAALAISMLRKEFETSNARGRFVFGRDFADAANGLGEGVAKIVDAIRLLEKQRIGS